jgi:hypothetical protein
LDIFPEGDPSSSPGLLYSATLGKTASQFPHPNGVAAKPARVHHPPDSFDVEHFRNPAGVVTNDRLLLGAEQSPRVAEYSNPGLEDGSPSGKMSKLEPPTALVGLHLNTCVSSTVSAAC